MSHRSWTRHLRLTIIIKQAQSLFRTYLFRQSIGIGQYHTFPKFGFMFKHSLLSGDYTLVNAVK